MKTTQAVALNTDLLYSITKEIVTLVNLAEKYERFL